MLGKLFEVESRAGARPEHRILRLSGPVNLETVPEFLRVVRAETALVVILDFSGVPYIDSAGVGSLVQTYVSFRRAERRVALVGFNERARAVLEVTRVSSVLPLYATTAAAEDHLAEKSRAHAGS